MAPSGSKRVWEMQFLFQAILCRLNMDSVTVEEGGKEQLLPPIVLTLISSWRGRCYGLNQKLANCQGPESKCFRLCSHIVSVATLPFCSCSESTHRQGVNVYGWIWHLGLILPFPGLNNNANTKKNIYSPFTVYVLGSVLSTLQPFS